MVTTHLHRSTTVVSCCIPNVLQYIGHVGILDASGLSSIGALSFQILDSLDILVLLFSPVAGNIAKPHLLTLVHKQSAGKRSVEHGEQLCALCSIFRVIRRNTRDNSRLVVVFQAVCQHFPMNTIQHPLVRVPSTLLLHLNLPSVENLFEIAQLPVGVSSSSKAARSSVKPLAEGQ